MCAHSQHSSHMYTFMSINMLWDSAGRVEKTGAPQDSARPREEGNYQVRLVHRTPNEGDPQNVQAHTSFHILFLSVHVLCLENLSCASHAFTLWWGTLFTLQISKVGNRLCGRVHGQAPEASEGPLLMNSHINTCSVHGSKNSMHLELEYMY